MKDKVKIYIQSLAKNRAKQRRAISVLCVLSIFVVGFVFWQLRLIGITLSNDASCGKIEHQHSEACVGERMLICGFPEEKDNAEANTDKLICQIVEHIHGESCYSIEQNLICNEEHIHKEECYKVEEVQICQECEHSHNEGCYASVSNGESSSEQLIPTSEYERHIHIDECYEIKYKCDLKEHTHTSLCYSDLNADVETSSVWENTLPKTLSGVLEKDLIIVAESQLGYTESENNFILAEDGETIQGYTRYGEWYGNKYSDWNSMFVSFCLHYAGVLDDYMPYNSGAYAWTVELHSLGLYLTDGTPEPGDILFFDDDNDGKADNVGILADTGSTIQGDVEGKVSKVALTSHCGFVDISTIIAPEEISEDDIDEKTNENIEYTITSNLPNIFTVGSVNNLLDKASVNPETDIDGNTLFLRVAKLEGRGPGSEEWTTLEVASSVTPDIVGYEYKITYEAYVEKATTTKETGNIGETVLSSITVTVSSSIDNRAVAESATGTNWIKLRDSGYFDYYSKVESTPSVAMYSNGLRVSNGQTHSLTDEPSDVQVEQEGGSNTSADGAVTVSKTIDGTDIENVFDITLQVQTTTNISEFYQEPDMAVVIVMDISNSMKGNFGDTIRYEAAMTAAENFLDRFAANSAGISKIGYVAFNTDAHEIFSLAPCYTTEHADALKDIMRTQTGDIINQDNYDSSYSRFTNIHAGLKMAGDMLKSVDNENKFVILLTDGFPTTYVSTGYNGYNPYTSDGTIGTDGVFYDDVLDVYCTYGTSYSDKAARKAKEVAISLKNDSSITIFSIGVDVGGQTIQEYIEASEKCAVSDEFSIVDRSSETYEIGDASSSESYKNWLRNVIGSGYYYDSTNEAGLEAAYEKIFAEIRHIHEESTRAVWVAEDPMPVDASNNETVEFIGFYTQSAELTPGPLVGANAERGENTASFGDNKTISWDLKKSGYTSSSDGGTTTFTYMLTYRVRLKNENSSFLERQVYNTNGTTTLEYQTLEGTDGNTTISPVKEVKFPIPAVEGYLSEFSFGKVSRSGNAVEGAEFTLSHNTENCSICRGDATSAVTIGDSIAVSDTSGNISFTNIPSGHQYTLVETKVPDGYWTNGDTYQVVVAYDEITLIATHEDGTTTDWIMDGNDKIVNETGYELPDTGGPGTILYNIGGLLMITVSIFLLYRKNKHRREGGKPC